MARLVFFIVVLAAIIVGVGYYRGWFRFSAKSSGSNPTLKVTVDNQKVEDDRAQAGKKIQDMERKVLEKLAPATPPLRP